VKERPILFSGEMVRAILDGRKTQTRRVIKGVGPDNWLKGASNHVVHAIDRCPYGKPGDRLWVRETWARYNIDQESFDIAYKATPPKDWPEDGRWRPSIHMFRDYSRITLEIKSVRVERLQDISEEDSLRDGGWEYKNLPIPESPFHSFELLWSKINGRQSWDQNSWVWVIEFERLPNEKN
jgi:hypothetical protein